MNYKKQTNLVRQFIFNNLPTTLIILVLLGSCHRDKSPIGHEFFNQYEIPEQTNDGWETTSLYSTGINETPLLNLIGTLKETDNHNIHSILIIKNGKLVFEEYFSGYLYSNNPPGSNGEYIQYDRSIEHFLASVTKSVTSVLFGIAINQGFISSVDDSLSNYLPQYSSILLGDKANITLKHLLTMTSGLAWDESTYPYGDYRNDITRLFYSSDPIRFILSKPLISLPGQSFVYKGGDTNVLGRIISQSSNLNLGSFTENYLFQPLGIEEYTWERFGSGDYFTSGGLYLRPRDLAKIGYLFLNKGYWNENQVISESWITESQSKQVITASNPWACGYGYQWWIKDFISNGKTYKCFFAAGWGDQHLFILPEKNMLIQFNGGNYYSPITDYLSYQLTESFILDSIND